MFVQTREEDAYLDISQELLCRHFPIDRGCALWTGWNEAIAIRRAVFVESRPRLPGRRRLRDCFMHIVGPRSTYRGVGRVMHRIATTVSMNEESKK